jgi:hypothetical protein
MTRPTKEIRAIGMIVPENIMIARTIKDRTVTEKKRGMQGRRCRDTIHTMKGIWTMQIATDNEMITGLDMKVPQVPVIALEVSNHALLTTGPTIVQRDHVLVEEATKSRSQPVLSKGDTTLNLCLLPRRGVTQWKRTLRALQEGDIQ